jgi:hypothetical protein
MDAVVFMYQCMEYIYQVTIPHSKQMFRKTNISVFHDPRNIGCLVSGIACSGIFQQHSVSLEAKRVCSEESQF